MVVKKLGVALALLALMEPAAAGVKFADEDVESEEALWRLYERWLAHFNVSRHPEEKVRRFSLFKEAARQIHRRAAVRCHAPGLNRFVDLSTLEFDSDYGCNDKPDEPADARLPVTRARRDGSLPSTGATRRAAQARASLRSSTRANAGRVGHSPRWERWRAIMRSKGPPSRSW